MFCFILFSIRVFFTDTDDSQDSSGREGTIFYSTLPVPPAHKHWDIYLQLCMWDDYHVFLIATLVYQTATRWDLPPYRITIWVIDWWCNVCLFTWWIDTRFLLQRFDIGNRWIWTCIDYHPCIASEPTNQVCLLLSDCTNRVVIRLTTSYKLSNFTGYSVMYRWKRTPYVVVVVTRKPSRKRRFVE